MSIFNPIRMTPCYKEYLWGGTRLKQEYGKTQAPDTTAESWELADLPEGSSKTEDGLTLSDLAQNDKNGFWGSACRTNKFPILVKLIDAAKPLSIQVHPSDSTAIAAKNEHGKAEMWYIVDCMPQAFIYYGFSQKIDKTEFIQRAEDGTICEVLNRVPVHKGNVFYILPGTIHAIGEGILIAEIQQNSNTTFRVYDYQRRDASGRLRELHLDRAAEVTDFEPIAPEECRANNSFTTENFTFSEMFKCKYFSAYRIDIHNHIDLECDGRTAQHILCVDGECMVKRSLNGNSLLLKKGESCFMPAKLGKYSIQGNSRVLLSMK